MSNEPSPTVLFVDDDPDSRLSYRWLFQRAGFDVKEASTGGDALRLAEEHPDVVVLDINLPDMNGFEVCRRIKAHPGTSTIPVLHLSGAYVSTDDRSHALEEGADAYLTKPVEPRELIAHVRALVRIHRAEECLRAVARQWQATFDAISDGVCLLDREGVVVRCNAALGRLTGQPPGDLVGRRHEELFATAASLALTTPFARMVQTHRRETGELAAGDRWLEATADPILAPDGTLSGAVYLVADVTERRRLEAQLRQAQKMEAIGQLAGGVAHDFNNLLTGILGSVSLLLGALPEADPNRELLLAVERLGWRAAELVRQLLGFSRRAPLQLHTADLRGAVRDVAAILRRAIDPRVRVEVRLADDLHPVLVDSSQITQVLMNLCLNARDAMPEGGLLLLEAENFRLDAPAAGSSPAAEEGSPEAAAELPTPSSKPASGEFVRLRVSDTGHGIAPDVMPRIFEPFFTTKPPGQGTGLGLAMVFGIVQQHHGWMECCSAPGKGTRFDVYLPVCAEATGGARGASRLGTWGGTETILLVDDEPAIRDLGQVWLRSHGYQVLTAEDGEEGVAVFERERGRIDLVVLDLTMPRLSGRDALRRMRAIDPRVRAIFASGYSSEQVDARSEGALAFVPKPYGEQELVAAVRSALDAGRPAH